MNSELYQQNNLHLYQNVFFSVQGHRNTNYADLINRQCIHVSSNDTMTHTFTQLEKKLR